MGEDADRFRGRALECRRLAGEARNQVDREIMLGMAEELEAEAALLDKAEKADDGD